MRKKRILIVDDEPEITQLVKMALEPIGNFTVFEENNARNAINAARRYDPDLIILDIMMPGRNGCEVADDLRGDTRLANVPILFLTALESQEVTGESTVTPSQPHYMSKPFELKRLVERVQRLCPK